MSEYNGNYNSDNQNKSNNNRDFIAFNSPPQSKFSPNNFSSPVKNKSYKRKQWNQSFNSSFSQSHNNSANRYSGPYNRSSNNSRNNSWSKNNHNNSKESDNISSFLHPSFVEDPWKKLEEELKKKISG
ncbi:uncharacterized protein DDB_G0280315-like [Coccinella septempunctata]|uniref:uncharacterized protein DDB_G0280315-like n=1 Tax=Coccinella septempunctata TaxID=41139 RepID=UPI001D06D555|nr:uncharacterized protein DDB_G0280315-like [Coccinella septempunctata]